MKLVDRGEVLVANISVQPNALTSMIKALLSVNCTVGRSLQFLASQEEKDEVHRQAMADPNVPKVEHPMAGEHGLVPMGIPIVVDAA